MIEVPGRQTLLRILLLSLLLIMGAGLAYAVLSLPAKSLGLSQSVADNIAASGVSNPVTAVVINFRGYDTMLEMAVLLLVLVAMWSLGPALARREAVVGGVLNYLAGLLVPLMILVSAYLLWVGAIAPGGAFQAGSLLAAAGVVLLLSGRDMDFRLTGLPLRFLIATGLAVFVIVGLALVLSGGRFLEFPIAYAGTLILVIETVATLSICTTLVALFMGGRPRPDQTSQSQIEAKTKK